MAYEGIIGSGRELKQDFKTQRLLSTYSNPEQQHQVSLFERASANETKGSFTGLKINMRSIVDALSLEINEPDNFKNTFDKSQSKLSPDFMVMEGLKPSGNLLTLLGSVVLLSTFILALIAGFKWIF